MKSALCFGNPQARIKSDRPLEALTTFKPFSVRELDFQVWEAPLMQKNEAYMNQYEEAGLLRTPQK